MRNLQKILVVEDEERLRRIFKRYLEPEYEVILASDGREGVDLAREQKPNLILLDLRMPRLDGLSALRLLKMSEKTVEIPVVVISAIGESDSLLDAQSIGALDYLIKPFDLTDVRRMVERYIT
jgi:DNA-binding response OmpR family regulator